MSMLKMVFKLSSAAVTKESQHCCYDYSCMDELTILHGIFVTATEDVKPDIIEAVKQG